MACCKKSSGMSKGIHKQVMKKLEDVSTAYPGTRQVCVLTAKGLIIAQSSPEDARESMSLVPSLRKSALDFASTLGQNSCPVVHVKGTGHLLSCLEIGDQGLVLAFFTGMGGQAIVDFDTADADSKLKHVVDELALLLNNVVVL